MKRLALAVVVLSLCLPAFAGDNKNNTPDLTGLPDLIVSDNLGQQWVTSVEEGNITPGTHTLVRFTVTTPNIGDADLYLGDPNDHVAAGDGLYEFATCHQ